VKTEEIRRFRHLARRFGRVLGALHGDAICCAGLTVAQAHLLLEIEDSDRTTIVELTRALRIGKGTVSRTVDALVDLGLVRRTPRPSDRRYNDLTLTPAGREAAAGVHKLGDDVVRRTFERIPPKERRAILETFETLVEASWAADGEQTERRKEPCGRTTTLRK
jgi:MarR family transcriptional regulator for hemolysin